MGLFNRLMGKGSAPATPPGPAAAAAATPAPASAPEPARPSPPEAVAGSVLPKLAAARDRLEARDLAGAVALYEEVLAAAGERADVLVTISGDLGSTGHIAPIIDLIAPRYDAERHGPATGLNLLQAYLAARDPEAAQHVLDLLFALQRPELEERLYGFSNAIAELMTQGVVAGLPAMPAAVSGGAAGPTAQRVSLVSISKPIWFYGLEAMAGEILPAAGRPRRIAFAQLAVLPADPAPAASAAATLEPGDELGRLARGIPLWLSELFFFSGLYAPIAALGLAEESEGRRRPTRFPAEWTPDNLRQLVDTTEGGLDYIITGALRERTGDFELILRVWEVRKFRERKQLNAAWTAATADAELARIAAALQAFMEWTPFPAGQGLPYAPPPSPLAWVTWLDASLGLFFAEKKLLAADQLPPLAPAVAAFAPHAAGSPSASLSWLTFARRAAALSLPPSPSGVALHPAPIVAPARTALGL